jgi:hypothetical protein
MWPIYGTSVNEKHWAEYLEVNHHLHGVEHFFLYVRPEVPVTFFEQYEGLVTIRSWATAASEETLDRFRGYYDQVRLVPRHHGTVHFSTADNA